MSWINEPANTLKYNNFNKCFVLTPDQLDKVADFAIKGYANHWTEVFLQDPNNWINKILLFPIEFSLPNFLLTPFSLGQTIGKYTAEMKIGSVTNTGIYANRIDTEVPIYLGEVNIPNKYKNFADYNGYTRIKCWLPYLGEIELIPNQCIGKYLEFSLIVDIQSGNGAYIISISKEPLNTGSTRLPTKLKSCPTIGVYNCVLGYEIPINNTNAAEIKRNLVLGAVQTVGNIALTAAGLVPTATTTSNETQSVTTKSTVRNPNTNRQIISGTNTQTTQNQRESKTYYKKNYASEVFDYGVSALNNMHLSATSDKIGNSLILENSVSSIYVCIYRPKLQEVDENYLKLYGKPLGQTKTLNSVHGFTKISAIHLEGQNFGSITKSEMAELEEALNDGIILP